MDFICLPPETRDSVLEKVAEENAAGEKFSTSNNDFGEVEMTVKMIKSGHLTGKTTESDGKLVCCENVSITRKGRKLLTQLRKQREQTQSKKEGGAWASTTKWIGRGIAFIFLTIFSFCLKDCLAPVFVKVVTPYASKELTRLYKNLRHPPPPSVATSNGAATPTSSKKEIRYDVVLQSYGSSKIKVISILKEFLGLSLKDATDMVEHSPCVLRRVVDKNSAISIKNRFEKVGAVIELRPIDSSKSINQE